MYIIDTLKKVIMLVAISFCSLNLYSQRVAINEIDKFTDVKNYKVDVSKGKRWKTSDDIAKGIFHAVYLSSKISSKPKSNLVLTSLNLQTGTSLCVSPTKGKTIFLLSDGSKLTLRQQTEITCNTALVVSYFVGNGTSEIESNLNLLSTVDIQSIRVYTTEGYVDFEVKDEKKQLIKNHFGMIKKEYGKLL